MINRIAASIRFTLLYQCSKCGIKAVGKNMVEEIEMTSLPNAVERLMVIDSRKPRPETMPEGWTRGGNGIFVCQRCQE
jgi:ribosomal protein L37AE/L43A